ncbi:MAG: dienelactone hydrolase family protein [Acidimicrobiia bacterium]|nr:dienelactone hydrolase family protein [Acidimicrobiia bacterium]
MRITLPSGTPAELASAEDDTGLGIALHPDIAGLRPLFDRHVAHLASEGFTTCAIEPWPGQEDMSIEKRMETVLDLDRVLDDLQAAADTTGCEHVGVLGFCMGGMETFRAAGTGRFHRAVAFYGMIVPPPPWHVPGRDPLDMLRRPETCPTLAIVGGQDRWTPPEDITALRQLPNFETAIYPDTDHGFAHDAERPSHSPDDAIDAWRRATEFLRGGDYATGASN